MQVLTIADLAKDKVGLLICEELQNERSEVSDSCIESSPCSKSLDSLLILIFRVDPVNEDTGLLESVSPAPGSCWGFLSLKLFAAVSVAQERATSSLPLFFFLFRFSFRQKAGGKESKASPLLPWSSLTSAEIPLLEFLHAFAGLLASDSTLVPCLVWADIKGNEVSVQAEGNRTRRCELCELLAWWQWLSHSKHRAILQFSHHSNSRAASSQSSQTLLPPVRFSKSWTMDISDSMPWWKDNS